MTRKPNFPTFCNIELLKCGLLVIIETIAAIFMRVFKFAHIVIFYVYKNTSSDFLSRVSFSFSFPITKAHTFFFKLSYFSNHRRLFILRRHYFGLRTDYDAVEFHNLVLKFCSIADTYQALSNIKSRTKR